MIVAKIKNYLKALLAVASLSLFLFILPSCDPDNVGDNLYTFKDRMMGQYLKDTTIFTEFARLLDTTKVTGLLNAYGYFTCFAPTNDAMKMYYKEKGKKSLKDFTLDSLKIIAYDHIINGSALSYVNFVNGRLPDLSMSERYISIFFTDSGTTYVNRTPLKRGGLIINKDVRVHNGYVHIIDRVLDPTRAGIVEAIAKDKRFSLFYEALVLTGLADSLLKDRDKTYDPSQYESLVTVTKDMGQWYYQEVPQSRKYGYTVLLESNATYNANGITNIATLKAKAAEIYDAVYPEDAGITDVKNRRNSLNRFIAYHLIEKQLNYDKFIDAYDTNHMLKTRDMYEYIETMCPNTLIEIKKERATNRTNLINYIRETGQVIQIVNGSYDYDATNGVFHEINGILAYSQDVDNELSTKRLRFDSSSFFSELTNNNMRGSRLKQNTVSDLYNEPSLHFQLPRGYISRITSSEQTVVGYLAGYHKFQNYEGDEIFLNATSGKLYDFTIITPPIPAGTYEVRFGYLTNGKRGVAQLYFDGIPCGVPLNLNTLATENGWQLPGSIPDDPNGFENDKMMRNRGYMKGPACYKVITPGWTSGENARYSNAILRRILGQFNFPKAGHHEFYVKGLSGGEFMFDYMEFVPTSALETEDVY
jgi:uncharacterized surface protein with fasciclin (FAS1) repeats